MHHRPLTYITLRLLKEAYILHILNIYFSTLFDLPCHP